MKKLITPFRVGLLVIAAAIFLFFFLTFVKKGGMSKDEAIDVYAYFKDASGLGRKSRVQIAGVPVGEIGEIVLDGGRAKVFLRIRRDVNLRKDAIIKKRSESLLGDYQLDLFAGNESSPPMEENGQIVNVVDQQQMEQIFGSLEKITSDIQAVTGSLRNVLGGDKGTASIEKIVDNLVRLSTSLEATVRDNSDKLSAILSNVQGVSSDLRGVTSAEQRSFKEIVENVGEITRDTKDVVATLKKIVGGGEGDIQESVASLKQTISRLDKTLENLESVTGKVRDGKGAVGTLLTDERVGQKISETVEDLSDFASRLTQLKTEVSIKSEFQMYLGGGKNTLGVRLIPKPDKYYLIEIVDDPRGDVTTELIQTNPPSAGQPVTQVQRITRDKIKFTAQFAKRYYFLTLRFGITESTGGIGADMHFFNEMLAFKLDAFNFSVEELRYPRLRATVRFQAFEHLFATVGVDDMLNRQLRDSLTNRLTSGRDVFVGGGVYFTDDDLKSVLTVAPLPSP